MAQSEAQAFLSAFAAVTTAPTPASPNVAPLQRQARKLRPVKLQSEESGSQSGPTAAFAKARTEPEANALFLRQLPQQQHASLEKQVKDPFLRPLSRKLESRDGPQSNGQFSRQTPSKTKRRPRRFVPLDQFETAPSQSHTNTPSSIKGEVSHIPSLVNDTRSPGQLLTEADFRERVAQHASHLRAVSSSPSGFFCAVKALLSCFHSSTDGELISLGPTGQSLQAATYCREVLLQSIPLFADYPAPVINAFREFVSDAGLSAPELSFPAATGLWTPCLADSSGSLRALETEPESVSRRLQGNLESTWDQILRLQRMYRGDISSCPPGTLDVNVALHAMAMLHPANMDFFAARLLKLVSDTGLHSRDTPVRMRQLGERLRDAPPRRHGQKGPGVVLHRLPELVRSMFEDDPAQLFFLDFLTAVDSAKLNTALIPRLVAAVAKALEAAAASTTNVGFTDAVLDARIYAKLLSVTMHASNWAHSAFSLSGMEDNQVSPGLGVHALQRRVPIHSAFLTVAVDLEALIRDAVASEHVLPVIACVAVADVIIRLAAVDPVAKASEWYNRGVHALRSVRAVSSTGSPESMPLLHTLVCALLGSESCREEGPLEMPDAAFVLRCAKTEWPAIGDTRLLRVVCPLLDDLRKSVQMPDLNAKATVRRITPQVAPNTASTLLQKAQIEEEKAEDRKENVEGVAIQTALRREFYARMDGRLRELIRVVASSRPISGTVAKERYLKVVEMLYPDTTKTVAAVAANLCEYEVGVFERELGKGAHGEERMDVDKRVVPDDRREVETTGKGIRKMKV